MSKSDNVRLMELQEMPVVQFYIWFNRQPTIVQDKLIQEYDDFIAQSKNSQAGKIYLEARQALADRNIPLLRELGAKARQLLADNHYDQAPQPYDPKFIRNQARVSEYRNIVAKTTADVPRNIVENLL